MSADAPADGSADGGSRPSKTNRAGPREASTRVNPGALSLPLTKLDGVSLRSETTAVYSGGVDAVSWREATKRWRDYIRESRETAAVFENPYGERVAGSDPNRFAPGYADKQYAKLKDLERGLREEYGKRLHTAMLTLTASSTDAEGEPRPPVDHLHDLDASWESVRRELHRTLEGRRWEYLAILEPHRSGYLHIHVAVFVEGVVVPETFRPVVEAHVRNCDGAEAAAHDLEAEDVSARPVSVKHVGADRAEDKIGNLGTYLAEYLHTYDGDPLDGPDHQQAANTVLWSTGKQRWRPSQGAQSYMAQNRSEEPSDWEIVAFRDSDGELHDVDGAVGGVNTLETCSDIRGDDPPG
jgi:hypothetical protein